MSSTETTTIYDPTDDTINTVITGILPLLLFGLYKGFENDKKKPFSFINVFDDFIIFSSIIVFPSITIIQWYPYYSEFSKKISIELYTSISSGLMIYIVYAIRHK